MTGVYSNDTGSPDVEFCGYTIPHPSETKMNIRIQTWGMSVSFPFRPGYFVADDASEDTRITAFDALRKGLEDLTEACDVVTEKFTEARDEFVARAAES